MKTSVTDSKNSTALATSADLDPLMERIGNARLVLLGEASHGTHEYYTWRSAITRRLIEEKGFQFVAVEGDWPDCYRVNRYVKGLDEQAAPAEEVLRGFNRWPTWMWANWEIVALMHWLRDWNNKRAAGKKVGFYGLDVYSLWESMDALHEYLIKNDPRAATIADVALSCFSGSARDEQRYAVRSLSESCRDEVVALLAEMRKRAPTYNHDPEAALNITQNAHIAVEAEKYYRNMIAFDEETWNIRDRHMMDTLDRILSFYGPASKAIVWEHNTHVGDARYTDMASSGLYNIGQLARERYAETVIVGFGSYSGTVMAADSWAAPMRRMDVPEAKENSIEFLLHSRDAHDQLIIFNENEDPLFFEKAFPHRAIGVVYNPAREAGNYVPSLMGKRYDAFCFIDRTKALHPLHLQADPQQVPETFPFAF
jgi:erythromycin esterase